MKTKNLFLMTVVLLFGAVITSSGQNITNVGSGSGTGGLNGSYFGINAGQNTTTIWQPGFTSANAGQSNVFIGGESGTLNTNGFSNVYCGYFAGHINDFGSGNVFVGSFAGSGAKTSNSVHIGDQTGTVSTGQDNVFVGWRAGIVNTTGSGNIFLNRDAGWANTTGSNNLYFGINAGAYITNGGGNIILGSSAGQGQYPATANDNVFIGTGAGSLGSSQGDNIFIGTSSGQRNNANQNIFIGNRSGWVNTSGTGNLSIGYQSAYSNSSGSYNTFYGQSSGGANTLGTYNTFIGFGSGGGITTGSYNTILGRVASNNSALSNTIILGDGATNQRFYIHSNGYAGTNLGNNQIPQNIFEIGTAYSAPFLNTTGLRFRNFTNTQPFQTNSTGGVLSLNQFGDVIWVKDQVDTGGGNGITNDCKSIFFLPKNKDATGKLTCSQIYDSWQGDCRNIDGSGVSIGWCDPVPASTFIPSGTVTGGPLGQTPTTLKLRVNGASQSNFTLITSDQNYKTNIQPLNREESLKKILNIKGYSYNWDKANNPAVNFDDNDHTGFIAQELETILPHLVYNTEDIISVNGEGVKYDKRKSVNYTEIIPYLVESIKALNERINGLEAQIQCLNETTGCNGAVVTKTNTTASLSEGTRIISVSPNPSNDVVSVALSIEKSVQTATLNVYDLNGKLMSSLNINDRSTNITKTLQKDNFGAGVYIVSLVVNGKSVDSKKIVFN